MVKYAQNAHICLKNSGFFIKKLLFDILLLIYLKKIHIKVVFVYRTCDMSTKHKLPIQVIIPIIFCLETLNKGLIILNF